MVVLQMVEIQHEYADHERTKSVLMWKRNSGLEDDATAGEALRFNGADEEMGLDRTSTLSNSFPIFPPSCKTMVCSMLAQKLRDDKPSVHGV